jgi:hypothetical protein
MAVQHLSYLDIPPEKRQKASEEARRRIQTLLSTPLLSSDQVKALQDQIRRIDQWERGDLDPLIPLDNRGDSHEHTG